MPTLTERSEVAICNLALQDVGRGLSLTALDENTQAARVCRLRYPFARDACLRAYDWNFAAVRASLPALAVPPAFGFANAYQLPKVQCKSFPVDDGSATGKSPGNKVPILFRRALSG